MNCRLVVGGALVCFFTMHAMESPKIARRGENIEIEFFGKFSQEEQEKKLLKMFDNIVDKDCSVTTNIDRLLKKFDELSKNRNTIFRQALFKHFDSQVLLKKMASELSNLVSADALNIALLELIEDFDVEVKDKAKILILAGADVNYNSGFVTPLLTAARYANTAAIDFLIQNGVKLNECATQGRHIGQTPLMAVILAQGSVAKSYKTTEYRHTIYRSQREIAVKHLLVAGAAVDMEDSQKKTALYYAHENGYEALEELIAKYVTKKSEI